MYDTEEEANAKVLDIDPTYELELTEDEEDELINFIEWFIMITLIRPLLFSFLQSDRVKSLIVEMLEKLAETTDNDIDNKAVEFIRNGLFPSK